MTRAKICCIESAQEAALAICAGASALGLVSAMPSGPGVVDEETIAAIIATVPPPIATFLLTSKTDPEAIIDQQRRLRPGTLQLVDRVEPRAHAELRKALPGITLVQVIHVLDEGSVAEAVAQAANVDALLLDSGNPGKKVKELGGTGRVHDWSLSARIVQEAPVPVFLAGGLKPENVGEAIRQVRPFGVDVCSGVRSEGRLDGTKLERFLGEVADSGS
jgi:phosphoribosylanthranilate isomerase